MYDQNDLPIRVTVVTASETLAATIEQALDGTVGCFSATWHALVGAESSACSEEVDIVVIDSTLLGERLESWICRCRREHPSTALVVVSPNASHARGVLRAGAQDIVRMDEINNGKFGERLSYALERQRDVERLLTQALFDPLTDLYNRRGFYSLADSRLQLARRGTEVILILLADVDGLKAINDRFGHTSGDQALREAARALQETFRKSDILARLSGDEFAVLITETNPAAALAAVSRLRQTIAANNNREPGRGWTLSLSVGVLPVDPQDACSVDQLIAKVDGRMYLEKTKRRTTFRPPPIGYDCSFSI